MKIVSSPYVFTLAAVGLVADAVFLRALPERLTTVSSNVTALSLKVHDNVHHEVVKKESISRKSTVDCLCKLGYFWHWRIKTCVEQGAWGYECGFFPEEHHDKVCKDGLKCQLLKQTRVKYFHPGAAPGSCQECAAEDKCLSGEKRHSESCLKEYLLSGSACQTVRVTVVATASAKVKETVTKHSTAVATATASDSQKAKVTEDGQTASATKEATADGQAVGKAHASAEASAKAKATEQGTAQAEACVSVDEVKKLMGLEKVKRLGAVLSSQVVSRGDELAFDRAYAKALDAAREAGLLNAKDAARARASAEAGEHAALEAEAKADEAAAWKAEAGAAEDAQKKAKKEALAKAEAAAREEAQAAADAAAQNPTEANEESAAQAKARHDAIADIVTPDPTEAPFVPTTPEPTNAPRKIPQKDIEAKLP